MIYSKKRDPPPKYQAQTLKTVDVVKATIGKMYNELRVHETVSESVRTVCLGLVENVQRARRYIAVSISTYNITCMFSSMTHYTPLHRQL